MSKLKLEDDFEDEATRFRQKKEDFVKKARDKKQKVWSKGEMFKVTWNHFIYEKWNRYYLLTAPRDMIVISLSDSDQFTTFKEDTLQLFRYEHRYDRRLPDHVRVVKDAPAYHLFPFLDLDMKVVWLVLRNSEDPIKDMRSIFSSSFKKV
jgi:hypothetical protein